MPIRIKFGLKEGLKEVLIDTNFSLYNQKLAHNSVQARTP